MTSVLFKLLILLNICRYEHSHGRKMSTAAAAQLMSVTLYYKRFFPYYAFCMIAGLDENGKIITYLLSSVLQILYC